MKQIILVTLLLALCSIITTISFRNTDPRRGAVTQYSQSVTKYPKMFIQEHIPANNVEYPNNYNASQRNNQTEIPLSDNKDNKSNSTLIQSDETENRNDVTILVIS